jgi:1,4-dihydroxy-6-naphthoate synthase
MGDKYGPMVVTREPMSIQQLRGKRIAIPGELTTAFLALQLCLGKAGDAFDYEVVPFDQILRHVEAGKADAGLIIHEGQLTYQTLGLHLVVDLGEWWDRQTGLPLPLGGNCIRKDLGRDAMQDVTDVLKQSIQFSLDHRDKAVDYALKFGRDLDKQLADRFVGMYVNDWTLDYGHRGKQAISTLLKLGAEAGLVPEITEIEYVTAR